MRRLWHVWRNLAGRRRIERELDEEVRAVRELLIEEKTHAGQSPKQARRSAMLELGQSESLKDAVRDARAGALADELIRDIVHAVRAYRRTPAFTAVVLLTLALGIGATTAIFSVVNGVLLEPLPYPASDRLIALRHATPNGLTGSSFLLHFTYQDESETFTSGLWINLSASVTGLGEPEQVRAILVTHQVLPILGVPPLVGRVFSADDDAPGNPLTAVLSYAYWRRRFGGAPSAIGQRLTIDGQPHEIIGVMPEGFRFLDTNADLFRPLQPDPSRAELSNFNARAIARLRPGASLEQARADLTRMISIAVETYPLSGGTSREFLRQAGYRESLGSLKADVVGDIGDMLWVLMGTVGLVLLIACANVANLLLVRAEGRRQELALRGALGAAWGRLARGFLVESVVLGLVGGLLGLGLAFAGLRLLVANGPANLPRLEEITIDPAVLLFALSVSLLSGLLFGTIPILQHAGPRLSAALNADSRTSSASRQRHRARGVLVIAQVALALVLLVSSGLMIRTFQALSHVDPGFVAPAEVQIANVAIPPAQVPDAEPAARMLREILERIEAVPDVESAAFGFGIPMGGGVITSGTWTDTANLGPDQPPPQRRTKFVSPGFLRTLGTPLLAGRDLDWTDADARRPVDLRRHLVRRLTPPPGNRHPAGPGGPPG